MRRPDHLRGRLRFGGIGPVYGPSTVPRTNPYSRPDPQTQETSMKRSVLFVAAVSLLGFALQAAAVTPGEIRVKKAIADQDDSRPSWRLASRRPASAPGGGVRPRRQPWPILTRGRLHRRHPEISTLPYAGPADAMVGAVDNFDLPADTANADLRGRRLGGELLALANTHPPRWRARPSSACRRPARPRSSDRRSPSSRGSPEYDGSGLEGEAQQRDRGEEHGTFHGCLLES